MEEKELLDLEASFEEIKSLPIAKYIVLPINADIEKYKWDVEKLKFPCWIKLNTGKHKQQIGAIESCVDFSDLQKKYKQLHKKFPEQKFIVQENVKGIEIIAGIKRDRVFGKTLLIGTGGSLAEIIKDISFRICPLDKEEIETALKELKIYPVLIKKDFAVKKLVEIIKKFSDLEISEADLNPIIVNEKQAVVVDARVSI